MFLSRPVPLQILVCDGIEMDPVTKRKTLQGVYPFVVAGSFPLVMPPVWLYVPFTGAQGMWTLTLRVVAPSGASVFSASWQVTCSDVGSVCDFYTQVRSLTFAEPGVYLIEALAEGAAFARREFRVIAKAAAPPA